jgi:hypothetical protein
MDSNRLHDSFCSGSITQKVRASENNCGLVSKRVGLWKKERSLTYGTAWQAPAPDWGAPFFTDTHFFL